MKHELAIYPRRRSQLWGFLGSILLVVLALGLLQRPGISLFLMAVCGVGILFFGFGIFACGYMLVRNLYKRRPQLLLDPTGITFFDGYGTPHPLDWAQIQQFRRQTIAGQKFILIDLKNPDEVIDAQKSAIRRMLMRHNLQQYGTPFNIATASLNYPGEALLPTLNQYLTEYKSSTHTQPLQS